VYALDPDVAETAALAHDIGHPPFGHVAEEALDEVVRERCEEGFEGNAQTFRVVTTLAVRHPTVPGLNLTRASLDAILKYPWTRNVAEGKKFGAYLTEQDTFRFARGAHPRNDRQRSLEAMIMDWADDITYAVHDLEDFYRAGLIPLDRLLRDGQELEKFYGRVFARWERKGPTKEATPEELRTSLSELFANPPPPEELLLPYDGSLAQRASLRKFTSRLIRRYILGVQESEEPAFELAAPARGKPPAAEKVRARYELDMLKRLTWEYVIYNPRLASQQLGQRKIVTELVRAFLKSAYGTGDLLTPAVRDVLRRQLTPDADRDEVVARIAADAVCRMADDEAIKAFQRISGTAAGSILDSLW
jgi:dGTPase